MQHITGISRYQLRISSLEDAMASDNQVRFIDAVVGYLDLPKLGYVATSKLKKLIIASLVIGSIIFLFK
jgi:hypothetical protein